MRRRPDIKMRRRPDIKTRRRPETINRRVKREKKTEKLQTSHQATRRFVGAGGALIFPFLLPPLLPPIFHMG